MANNQPVVDLDFDDLFKQANEHATTEGAVAGRAGRIAKKARQINAKEGGTANISVRQRHLPTGRMSYDVVSDNPDEEYGSSESKRLRQLRRAAREVRR